MNRLINFPGPLYLGLWRFGFPVAGWLKVKSVFSDEVGLGVGRYYHGCVDGKGNAITVKISIWTCAVVGLDRRIYLGWDFDVQMQVIG